MKTNQVQYTTDVTTRNYRVTEFIKFKNLLDEIIVGGKVICDTCNWKWDISDGGEQPYLCHKCGNDNTPIKEGDVRIPRKKGQKSNSTKHSDLYTDENPKGTIHGLKFATVEDAKKSVSKIRNSDRAHAHKIQAAIAMEQRAKVAGKTSAAAVYRSFINSIKKTNEVELQTINTEQTSTERVRKYYKKHPNKVRKYLKKTQDDRVARNRDRRKAVDTHGKTKMKNHDVHHPNGPHNGGARLAKKDHGRDKVNEAFRLIITEGGAAGHMAHPYEDDELTFAQVKEMIHRGLVGSLDAEAPVTEKLDGQNIAFTIVDGVIRFARNKGQVKNKAKNALDVAGIRSMFAGRGNIERAFTGAAEDLQDAIGKMPPEQRDAIFGNGSKFMNVEIIFPDTKNVIPYDKSVLVFHGTIEYDESGEEIGRSQDNAQAVHSALVKANADKQKTFGIQGPHTISFSDTDTSRNKRKMQEYIRRMQRVQNEYKLDDNSTIEDYKREWWGREIDAMGWEINEFERERLIDRWAMGIKKFGAKDIEDKELKQKIKEFEAEHVPSLQRKVAQPLERTFLQVGTDAMRRVTDFLGSNNPELATQLKKEVLDTIRELQNTDDQNKLAKLQQQVERLDALGVNNIVPSEGIVFVYNGKPYKFTGIFAPVNQILGTLKFAAGEATIVKPDESPKKSAERKSQPADQPSIATAPKSGPSRTVAIFSGRFQPFHAGHYSVYQSLVEKFGKDNVYIASSDVTDPVRSPFPFTEKHKIITTMFDVPEDRVIQVANPYAPTEILEKLPPNTTYVTAVSQKDAERLGAARKYFRPYEDGKSEEGFADRGYFIVAPEFQLSVDGKNISGTQLRQVMGDPRITERAKKEIFTKVYGKFNPEIFKKIVKTTTESEESRQLTAQYGKGLKKQKKKPAARKQTKKSTTRKKPDATSVSSARDVLRQRIKNLKTGREIYVATALGYEPTDPMRRQAEKLVRQAIAKSKKKK